MERTFRVAVLAIAVACLTAPALARGPLSFEERVKAQEAIERVYYNHRIWPKENPQPKPAFEQMVPRSVIEAKVTDYLKKCNALDKFWQRPIEPNQLQAEMDRMAKGTKDPATLRELFSALGDDPYLIAECLARPVLGERLVRNWLNTDNAGWVGRGDVHKEKADTSDDIAAALSDRWREVGEFTSPMLLQGQSQDFSLALVENASLSSSCQDYWEHSTLDDVILPRKAHCSVWTGTEMIVWGGGYSFGNRYSPATDTWSITSQPPGIPQGTYGSSAIWTGTEMIVWGGYSTNYPYYSNKGSRYDPTSDSWQGTSEGTNVADPRAWHTATWTGSSMIIWGGTIASNTYTNTGGIYIPASNSWLSTSTGVNSPTARWFHTAVWADSRMIIWGGITTAGSLDTGAKYDPANDTWSTTSTGPNLPQARSRHTAIWTGSEMIIWGGSNLNSGGRYNPSNDSWITTSTSLGVPSARYCHTSIWTGQEMIIWGGRNDSTGFTDTGSRYDPLADSWCQMNINGAPGPRGEHSAVWTGDEMIIWGGYNTYSNLGLLTGGRYNPVSDSWVSTSTANSRATLRRDGHSAIWTGAEAIFWGGELYSDSTEIMYNSGDCYNPAIDEWGFTSIGANCPSARADHSTVWTGTEMIIWGGLENPGGSACITGARYNPVSDSWISTSISANCPEARTNPSVTWTGTEMIIWGGIKTSMPSMPTNSGARYNPSNNSWVPTQLNGAPSTRQYHTAIWTGNEMIIWGGDNWGGPGLSSGGKYNPIQDIWLATSEGEGCASGRTKHSAIWTGQEMIIWGGEGDLNTGSKYYPTSNTWATTSIGIDCPSGRLAHSAVWTGREMLIWGGYKYNSGNLIAFSSGSKYDPAADSWEVMSTDTYCPPATFDHKAVWTGTRMIMYGGKYTPTIGGIYSPGGPMNAPPISATDLSTCDTGINILWPADPGVWNDGSSGSRSYQIIRDNELLSSGECSGLIPYGTANCTDATTAANNTYSYQVAYINGCGESSFSPISTLQDIGTLTVPTIQGPSGGCQSVTLTTQSYTSYQWNLNSTAVPSATQQTFTANASGLYTVSAIGNDGCSVTSPSHNVTIGDCAVPSFFPEPQFTKGTSNMLIWNTTPNATHYEVQASTDSFLTILRTSGQITVNTYNFTALMSGMNYQYRVKAIYPFGNSNWSTMVNSTQDAELPTSSILTPLSGATLVGSSVLVSGSANDSISGLNRVEISWDGGASWHLTNGTATWQYLWTLPADGSYLLLSRAVDAVENIETQHGIAVAVHNLPQPATGVVATDIPFDGGGVILVSWVKSADDGAGLNYVGGYAIFRGASVAGPFQKIGYVPAGQTSYEDLSAGVGISRYYKVRTETIYDVMPNYTDSSIVGPVAALDNAPLPVNNLQADLTYACNVRLTWIESPSPDILLYNIYYDGGTGTVNYSTPLGTVSAPATTWVSSGLALGTRYIFSVRAKDMAGQEDALTANLVSISTTCGTQPRAEITQPPAGRKIKGTAVTVRADLIQGTPAETGDVLLQYRQTGTSGWTDMVPAAGEQNPDPVSPYVIHWDVSTLPNGDYDLRGIASALINGAPDPAPPFVTVTVNNAFAQISENNSSGDHIASYEAYRGSGNRSLVAFERDGNLFQATIPKGSLPTQIGTVEVRDLNPSAYADQTFRGIVGQHREESGYPEVGLTPANMYRKITLEGAVSTFSLGVDLVFFFRDDNGDGILDGTDIPIAQLDAFHEEVDGTWSLQSLNRTLDTVNKYLRVTVTQTGTYGLFTFPKPNKVEGLMLSKSGADASLAWLPVTQDEKGNAISVDHYNIYWGAVPSFYPDLIGNSNLLGQALVAAMTDAGALSSTDKRFYLVTAVDGSGRESYPK